jgi:hypothetical protein
MPQIPSVLRQGTSVRIAAHVPSDSLHCTTGPTSPTSAYSVFSAARGYGLISSFPAADAARSGTSPARYAADVEAAVSGYGAEGQHCVNALWAWPRRAALPVCERERGAHALAPAFPPERAARVARVRAARREPAPVQPAVRLLGPRPAALQRERVEALRARGAQVSVRAFMRDGERTAVSGRRISDPRGILPNTNSGKRRAPRAMWAAEREPCRCTRDGWRQRSDARDGSWMKVGASPVGQPVASKVKIQNVTMWWRGGTRTLLLDDVFGLGQEADGRRVEACAEDIRPAVPEGILEFLEHSRGECCRARLNRAYGN